MVDKNLVGKSYNLTQAREYYYIMYIYIYYSLFLLTC